MEPLFAVVVATAICMAVIPVVWRFATPLGLMDMPDARKVHTSPVPRVGGFGIVIGALAGLALLLDFEPLLQSYVWGTLILFLFGVWDDRRPLGHRTKFIGQLIAAAIVVFHGGLWIEHAPFMGLEILSKPAGVALTFFAIVGMINAINTSDGLDGLAGGEALLSLMVIAFLATMVDGTSTAVIAATGIGGILGFLRFNTYPAQVFMGDAGSQHLGFTLAFLAILLTQRTHPALSPAVTLLFLGLPIIDILSVMIQRIARGVSPFVASRNHLHHRLMGLGFDHHETVTIIYVVQAIFVCSAILLRYENDWLIAGIYLTAAAILFGLVIVAERSGWRAQRTGKSGVARMLETASRHTLLNRYPYYLVACAVPVYLLYTAIYAGDIPRDFAITSAVLAVVMLVEMLLGRQPMTITMRGTVYVAIVFSTYLASRDQTLGSTGPYEYTFFIALVLAVILTMKFASSLRFHTTPMDYLILSGVVVAAVFGQGQIAVTEVSLLIVKAVLLLYASEVIIDRTQSRWSLLNLAAMCTLGLIGMKGLMLW